MSKIYYEKRGRRYVPVAEYDPELLDSYPKGTHLVMCYPGGISRKYNIDPDYAAMIAAGRVAEDAISRALYQATEVRPQRKPITQIELDAWQHLVQVMGDEARTILRPSSRDIAEAGVKAMEQEAEQLLKHPAVRKAYDNFLLICKLTKEAEK